MADSGFYAPGAIETLALHIKSFDDSQEVIDLRDICTVYNIYEDVYSHCLHAEVNINDALNIYDELPMCGDEVIELSFKTASSELMPINLLFRVYKIGDRIPVNDKMFNYTLYCVSEEEVVDTTTEVQESFNHESGTDIIEKIFKAHLKNASTGLDQRITGIQNNPSSAGVNSVLYPDGKQLHINEEATGLYSYVGHGETALTTIDKLSGELENTSINKSCTWLFWENFEGFNFETLEKMAQKSSIEEYIYVIKNKELSQSQASQYNEYQKIDDLIIEPMYDSLDSMLDGGLGSKSKYIDPVTKTYNTVEYNYGKAFQKETHMERNPNKNKSFLDRYPFEDIKTITMWSDFSQQDCKYIKSKLPNKQDHRRKQNFFPKKLAWTKNFEAIKIRFSVPGDSAITTGQCIDVFIPAPSGLTRDKDQENKYVSGKFLITSIRHEIDMANQKYVTYIEGVKDTFGNEIQPIRGS
tara:strand:- start:6708 stop:8114 length:1407 start_codon:yes stop_codon:yes gene_type:complete